MDDLPIQKVQISGPTLASLLQQFSSSPGDIDGLLYGCVTHVTPSALSDDPTTSTSTETATLVATITSFLSFFPTTSFYTPTGHLHLPTIQNLTTNTALIGWFSGRRRTHLRPSMRESSVTSSLSSTIQLSLPVENAPQTLTFSPCIFLLLTTPFQEQLIHTHEYKAFQFRISTDSFEPKTLDVVNIGPAFRGHYGAFYPNSIFPAMPCEFRGANSMLEDNVTENNSLKSMERAPKDQKELDLCAEGFDIGRLSHLMGSAATNYTAELEGLYDKMLAKLDGLASMLEKSSARVHEQENHNMKLRHKIAGLE